MHITKRHMPKRINNPQTAIQPEGIILHYIGNPGTGAGANANYFANVQSQVSVHYIVDDDEVIEIIPPDRKSYGTAKKEYNEKYIQIEMCHPDSTGKISEKTLENAVWLCKKLIKEYGICKVIRHYDATGKKCPLWYVNHPVEWNLLQARIVSGEEEGNMSEHWAQVHFDNLNKKGVVVHETRFDEPVKRGEVFALLDRLTDVMRPKEGETGSGDKEGD